MQSIHVRFFLLLNLLFALRVVYVYRGYKIRVTRIGIFFLKKIGNSYAFVADAPQ